MVELRAVRAFHPARVVASELVAPVYDTLSDADLARFSHAEHNAARFVARPSSQGVEEFAQSAQIRLRQALQAGAYRQDSTPSLYVYGIRYVPPPDVLETLPSRDRRAEYLLLGLVGSLDLASTPESMIARHENAFPDRIDERIRVTRATGMHFAPIMAGYTLPSHEINDRLERFLGLDRRALSFEGSHPPLVRAMLDGSEHRLWALDGDLTDELVERVRPLRLLILDGHHRYGASRALLQRHEAGAAPLVMLVESRDRALHLLPWHRALARGPVTLEDLRRSADDRFVSVEPLGAEPTPEAVLHELERMSRQHERGFLALQGSEAWRFRGRDSTDGGYDFDLLHGYLSQHFGTDPHAFVPFRSPRQAIEGIGAPGGPCAGGVAFFLPALHEEAIEERAFELGHVMAHKSTMFLPKVAEGVIFAPVSPAPS